LIFYEIQGWIVIMQGIIGLDVAFGFLIQ
jgi:hypothetical protein